MSKQIKTWQERMQDHGRSWTKSDDPQSMCKDAEIAELRAALSAVQAPSAPVAPDLFKAEKLVPYEIRYFETPGMAEALGYKVVGMFQRTAAPAPPQPGEA